MIPDIFVPDLQSRLAAADAAERTTIMVEQLKAAFDALPPIVNELREADQQCSPDACIGAADHYVALLADLWDGCGEKGDRFDWYDPDAEARVGYVGLLRMAFMGRIIQAHRQTGDARYPQAAHDFLMNYVDRHFTAPDDVPEKANWLNVPIRAGVWYHMHLHGGMNTVLCECCTSPDWQAVFTGDELIRVLRCIAHSLNAMLPEMCIAANWRRHQVDGVFTAGLCYPFLKDAAMWLQTGVNSINEDFEEQFLPDGSFEELTLGYGRGCWTIFCQYFSLSQEVPQMGLHLDAKQLERTLEYYLSCLKPFGISAAFGDVWVARGGQDLDVDSSPHECLDEDGRIRPETWGGILANAKLVDRYVDFPAARFVIDGQPHPEWTTRFQPSTGYIYMRNGWHPESLYMNFSTAYYTKPHSHLDLLAVEVAGFGREWIVDPGNAGYVSHPTNHNMNLTRSHSTMCVDSLSQCNPGNVQLSRLTVGDNYDFTIGIYLGGYVDGTQYGWEGGVCGDHYRHVLFVKGTPGGPGQSGGYWVILDAMNTRVGHTVETRFQFMPTAMKTLPQGGYATGYRQGNLAIIPLAWDGWEHGIHCGEGDPIEGWLPTGVGQYTPAPMYKATKPAAAATEWHGTLLFPYRQAHTPRIEVRRADVGDIGFGYEIISDEFRDVLFVSNSFSQKRYRIGEVESDCPVCHQRFVDGRPTNGYTCDGSFLSIDGTDIFRKPGSLRAREYTYGQDVKIKETKARMKHR